MAKRKGKKVKQVSNTFEPKRAVQSGIPPTRGEKSLTFDLSYEKWMKGVNMKKFTNKLKDMEQHSLYTHEIFSKVIPNVHRNWDVIKKSKGQGQFTHCHILDGDKKQLAIQIAEEIHGKTILDEESDFNVWQFGVSNSIRIIAVYDHHNDIAFPLFLDYHHLIYPSVKYNQSDYEKYDFCPHLTYSS
ncbi:hypothetical protein ACFTRE_10730 [Bacillus subtilis]|uniref:hypothetical protein n=1 Tax=Bacillus subtilis group TaxID=653685 RepID=UPI0002B4098B|nr:MULTISPECIES: hypothetical protein [Bacillus subtilis group]AGE62475.1 hypothetical protein C663_0629 [Bacillus subtilis XF-1]MBA5716304.1 hypothetical protein [Bacillus subtilis]MCM3060611.1 hypothetical protein [Bacillus subtilis]MED0870211.1 hypothetical protein [Bacillus spizizenii]MED1069076.1 hypothetical protein [Bacillus spizizenii]